MQFNAVGSTGGEIGGARGGDELKVMALCLWLNVMWLSWQQVKIDALVGAECLYCGDMMIQSINKPFIPWEQFQASLDSWK